MKPNAVAIIIVGLLIGGAIFISKNLTNGSESVPANNNVTVQGDKQIVELRAKGGYQPRKSTAKAGMPTILKIDTNGTFDCSSSVRIPSMNISRILPATGSTEIDLGSPGAGVVYGTCGMGMYPFEIDFQG
jgi:plastocyanin domain-containing protein